MVNFYLTRGLTYEDAGFIESIVPFLGCLFRPSVCYFADRYAIHRALLITSYLIYVLSLAGFAFLSIQFQYVVTKPDHLHLNTTDVTNTTNEFVLGKYPSEHRDFLFPIFCGLRFLCTLGVTPASSLLDGLVYHSLEEQGEANHYGRQRLWGALGFTATAFFSSFLLDEIEKYNFLIGFSIALFSALGAMVGAYFLVQSYQTVKTNEKTDVVEDLMDKQSKKTANESHLLLVCKFVFSDPHILVALVVAGAIGCFSACREVFASQYIENLAQVNSKKIFGVTQGIICSFEIPSMFISGYLLLKFGTLPFMALALLAFGLSFLFYSMLTRETVWLLAAIDILHIFCFALAVPAFTYHAHKRVAKYKQSLPEMSVLIQGLVSGMFLGLGFGAGCIAGGVLMQSYGGYICMRIFSIAAFASFASFCTIWLVTVVYGMQNKRTKPNANETEEPNGSSELT